MLRVAVRDEADRFLKVLPTVMMALQVPFYPTRQSTLFQSASGADQEDGRPAPGTTKVLIIVDACHVLLPSLLCFQTSTLPTR